MSQSDWPYDSNERHPDDMPPDDLPPLDTGKPMLQRVMEITAAVLVGLFILCILVLLIKLTWWIIVL